MGINDTRIDSRKPTVDVLWVVVITYFVVGVKCISGIGWVSWVLS